MYLYDVSSSSIGSHFYLKKCRCLKYMTRRVAEVIVCASFFIIIALATFIISEKYLWAAEQEVSKKEYPYGEEVDDTNKMKDSENGESIMIGHRPSVFDLVLTEVCYRPKAGQKEWIELTNVSDKMVDINGWSLVDGNQLDFLLAQESVVVPPGGVVLVIFDGTGEKPQLDEKGVLLIHSPKGIEGNILSDKGGHLAVYAPGKNGNRINAMRSYTAWGESQGKIISDAIASGRWGGISDVPNGTGERVKGMGKWIEDGGTIGFVGTFDDGDRVMKGSWQVFTPDESSPGEFDPFGQKRKPVLHLPEDGGGTGDDGRITLSCVRMEKGVRYHFQICMDKQCNEVFEESTDLNAPYYSIEKPIPKGSEVYWRVRVTFPNGSNSSWSELRSLINYN